MTVVPLAERLRPQRLEEVLGQPVLLGPDGLLTRLLAAGRLPSLVLFGPPGTGKTTIARLLAAEAGLAFAPLSATDSGVAALRKALDLAEAAPTLLFLDEIHRWSRAQQDALLPPSRQGGTSSSAPRPSIRGTHSCRRCCRACECCRSSASTTRRSGRCWPAPRPRSAACR